jgi:AcrR family transcriptional regulator
VYKYFKNKEDLLEQALHLQYEQQYQMLQNLTSNQRSLFLMLDSWIYAVNRVHDVNNIFYHDLHYYYSGLEQKIELEVGRKFGTQFQTLVKKGIAEGDFQADLNPDVAMEGIYILYNSITRTDLFERYDVSLNEILKNTIVKYIRGICTSGGIVDLENYLAAKQ